MPISPQVGAKQRTVKSITDGDTLKLENGEKNGERNRLVGINTPEMRPVQQAYAIEATEYLEAHCRKSNMIVYQSFGRFI
jgi:endonuclease YncB( thermonuclease family)